MCLFLDSQNVSSTRWRFWSLLFRIYPQYPEQCLVQNGVSVNEQIQGKKPGEGLESAFSGREWERPGGGWAVEDASLVDVSP